MKLTGLKNIKYELDNLGKDFPHVLLTGSRGTGKTMLARYLAEKYQRRLLFLTGNTLKKDEIIDIFIHIKENDIILVDEIHNCRLAVEEVFYQPLEEKILPLNSINGCNAILSLPKFSLIGTTTKTSLISKPLISRFQIEIQIPHYNLDELSQIIKGSYPSLSLEDCALIAENITTPREAVNLARRIVKFPLPVRQALEFIGFRYGLSCFERDYIKILYNVKKIAFTSLSFALQLDKDIILKIEDKLIKNRFLEITSRGRQLSTEGIEFYEKYKF